MFTKKTWFTSDWHVGHLNVLRFCPERNCAEMQQMCDLLISNYNSVVKGDHVCYFLGDFMGIRGFGQWVLPRLRGTKILVRGNHDHPHQSMLNMGFDAVMDSVSFKVGDLTITASHYPLAGVFREDCSDFRNYNGTDLWHGEKKAKRTHVVVEDIGQDIHLHGHIHSPGKRNLPKIDGKQYDVGVDANNMSPISLNQIIKQMNKRRPK